MAAACLFSFSEAEKTYLMEKSCRLKSDPRKKRKKRKTCD